MNDRKRLGIGIAGTATVAVCCFTPVLVVLFGALGLSALTGWWLDAFVLYPALLFFMALTGYALHRQRTPAPVCAPAAVPGGDGS